MILAFSVLFLGLLFYALPANAYYVYTNHGAVSMDNDYEYDPHYTYVSNPFANLTNTNHDNSNQTIGTTQNNTSVKTTAKTSNNTIIKTTEEINDDIVVASDASDINENYGDLTANAVLGSNSFMPSGLVQWIFLAILVFAIIFLWRYALGREKYMSEPLKHA